MSLKPPPGPMRDWWKWSIKPGDEVRVRLDVELGEGEAWCRVTGDGPLGSIIIEPLDPTAPKVTHCGRGAVLEVRPT